MTIEFITIQLPDQSSYSDLSDLVVDQDDEGRWHWYYRCATSEDTSEGFATEQECRENFRLTLAADEADEDCWAYEDEVPRG